MPGNRRRPYRVRVTTSWEHGGVQRFKTIGYFATSKEAMVALAEYNKNPYSLDAATITFAELFEKWSADKFDGVSHSTINGYKAAYNHAKKIHDMRFVDIRADHMRGILKNCERSHGTKRKIKMLFNQLFKYAMEHDIVTKDYSSFISAGSNEEISSRKPFLKPEIKLLWENVERMDYIDTILIMIATGLRPGELVLLENANIDFEQEIMRGGIKTAAGKNRVIPIHPAIMPYVKARYNPNNKYFLTERGDGLSYYHYYHDIWQKIMEQLRLKHKPHECRHTFASLADSADMNKVCIKRIMGHASKDITDRVYTHKDIKELKSEIRKISFDFVSCT